MIDERFVYKIIELICGGKVLDGFADAVWQQICDTCGKGHFSFCDLGNFVTFILLHIFVLLTCLQFTPCNITISCWPVHIYIYLKQCQQSCFGSMFLEC
jgi:hypothetical protein